MTHPAYNLSREKEQLSAALSAVYEQGGTARMADAYKTLAQAVKHAEQAVTALKPPATRGRTAKVQVLGLNLLIQYGREELARAGRAAPAVVRKKKQRPAWR